MNLKQIILAASLALTPACVPTEEEAKEGCDGSELFCDDFSGNELDLGKWHEPCGEKGYNVGSGNLEMGAEGVAFCELRSRATYCIDGKKAITSESSCLPLRIPLVFQFTCKSEDNQEKSCGFDNVKVIRKI